MWVLTPLLIPPTLKGPKQVCSIYLSLEKMGIFEWALCKMVVSLLPDCFVGVNFVSHCGMLPLPGIVRQAI